MWRTPAGGLIIWSWVRRWAGIARGEAKEKQTLAKALDKAATHHPDPKTITQLRTWGAGDSMEDFSQKTLNRLGAVIQGARQIWAEATGEERDNKAERELFQQKRAIMNRVWRSISALEARCQQKKRLVEFRGFEQKILKWAQELEIAYATVAESMVSREAFEVGGTKRLAYKVLAKDRILRAQQLLDRIRTESWFLPGSPGTATCPTHQLRILFYEPTTPRNVLRRRPQLCDFPLRALNADLFYFNVVNFFRFFTGRKAASAQDQGEERRLVKWSCLQAESLRLFLDKELALEKASKRGATAGQLAQLKLKLEHKKPNYKIARVRANRFARRFCPGLVLSREKRRAPKAARSAVTA